MEKATLKTLIYADIFDYPLKAWEIHKWLIGQKLSLQQVEKILERMLKKKKIRTHKEYYFLPRREKLVVKRMMREKISQRLLREARSVSFLLRLIPWVRLVGVSGALAVHNAAKDDDIDLFIITENGRLWVSRFLVVGLLELLGKRRTPDDDQRSAAGKICVNVLLEEQQMLQQRRDLYTAHEILQMKVLWARKGSYSRFLLQNDWSFAELPNWISTEKVKLSEVTQKPERKNPNTLNKIVDSLEAGLRFIQMRYMKEPEGSERIDLHSLYFHPHDYQQEVLELYQQKLKKLRM
jgi:hypothetical protein